MTKPDIAAIRARKQQLRDYISTLADRDDEIGKHAYTYGSGRLKQLEMDLADITALLAENEGLEKRIAKLECLIDPHLFRDAHENDVEYQLLLNKERTAAADEIIAHQKKRIVELEAALRLCGASFVIGDEKSLITFDALAREFNNRQIAANAAINSIPSTGEVRSNEAPALSSDQGAEGKGIYVASRVKRAPVWLKWRATGQPIISTWIDEAGEGETADLSELWTRVQREVSGAAALIFYAGADDFPLKGALVEVGIALGAGIPVFLVLDAGIMLDGRTLRPLGSWALHPLVTRCADLADAFARSHSLLATENTGGPTHPTPTGGK